MIVRAQGLLPVSIAVSIRLSGLRTYLTSDGPNRTWKLVKGESSLYSLGRIIEKNRSV